MSTRERIQKALNDNRRMTPAMVTYALLAQQGVELTEETIRHHLRSMEENGVVRRVRGTRHTYVLNK